MSASKPSKEAMVEAAKFCPRDSANSEVMNVAYLLDAFAAERVADVRIRAAKVCADAGRGDLADLIVRGAK